MSKITLSSNLSSLMAQRQLGKSSEALAKSSERLSSGMRINRASDDAAGLAISTGLKANVRVYSRALLNVNDGVSALNIAEGALSEITSVNIRLQELSEQAAHGTFSLQQRKAIQKEADALTQEHNRILETTTFNGIRVFDTGFELSIQAGFGTNGGITSNAISQLTRSAGDGTFSSATYDTGASQTSGVTLADFNNDGFLDIIGSSTSATVDNLLLGNGNGTFKAPISFVSGTTSGGAYAIIAVGDFNRDGNLDAVLTDSANDTISVHLGNGDGTFKARTSHAVDDAPYSVVTADFNGDGLIDIATGSANNNTLQILLSNGNGTFRRGASIGGIGVYGLDAGDMDNDGIIDLICADSNSRVLKGDGSGGFSISGLITQPVFSQESRFLDVNRDGNLDIVSAGYGSGSGTIVSINIGNGNGTFNAGVTYTTGTGPFRIAFGDINTDGLTDLVTTGTGGGGNGVSVLFSNGDGTFKSPVMTGATFGYGLAIGDVNRDGINDVVTSFTDAQVWISNTTQVMTAQYLDLLSQDGARQALNTTRTALERITLGVGAIGAIQSRLKVTANVLQSSIANETAAETRIIDADVAEESAQYARLSILQQTGAAILAQANQSPALALTLLRG